MLLTSGSRSEMRVDVIGFRWPFPRWCKASRLGVSGKLPLHFLITTALLSYSAPIDSIDINIDSHDLSCQAIAQERERDRDSHGMESRYNLDSLSSDFGLPIRVQGNTQYLLLDGRAIPN